MKSRILSVTRNTIKLALARLLFTTGYIGVIREMPNKTVALSLLSSTTPLYDSGVNVAGNVQTPYRGTFFTRLQPGDTINREWKLACIVNTSLSVSRSLILRDIIHYSVPVSVKTKTIQVDLPVLVSQILDILERPVHMARNF
ncbi:MAG: hypothetical protein FD147_1720 [Chloroflexi bacterium]|nr:MAG: hypothetical protein FD147_1720 [Chloroflexota bacterium]